MLSGASTLIGNVCIVSHSVLCNVVMTVYQNSLSLSLSLSLSPSHHRVSTCVSFPCLPQPALTSPQMNTTYLMAVKSAMSICTAWADFSQPTNSQEALTLVLPQPAQPLSIIPIPSPFQTTPLPRTVVTGFPVPVPVSPQPCLRRDV